MSKREYIQAFILAYGLAILTSCSTHNFEVEKSIQSTYIPQAPDYNDATMWINVDGDKDGTGADVFYVVSTWEEDWVTKDGRICHYADVWNPEHREHMATKEIAKVAAYITVSTPLITATRQSKHS